MQQEPKAQGIEKYIGKSAVSQDGGKLGLIDRFFNDRLTDVPTWMALEGGLLGTKKSVVPVAGVSFEEDSVLVPYTEDVVNAAPDIDLADGLTPEDEALLAAHFELGAPESPEV